MYTVRTLMDSILIIFRNGKANNVLTKENSVKKNFVFNVGVTLIFSYTSTAV